jgi:predicted amidohydrolase
MTVCIDKKFPKFRKEIINAIRKDEESKDSTYKFSAFNGEEVGMSFEPRIKVTYNGSNPNGELRGIYEKTFIFDKKYEFVTSTKGDWIKIFPD